MSEKQANCSNGIEGQDRRQAMLTIAVTQKVRDSCTTIKKQASSGHSQKAQDHGQATNFLSPSRMAVAPQGHQHCGQGNLLYSKPQLSWPTRAIDIAGKLVLFDSKPQRSRQTRALNNAGKWPKFFSKPQRSQPTRA
jgi:hypothetical protein